MKALVIITLIIFLGLNTKSYQGSKHITNKGSIEVLFYKGDVETVVSIKCGEIKNTYALKSDTSLLTEGKYDELIGKIKSLKESEDNKDVENCDVRIQVKVKYENGITHEICIDGFNCLIKDGKKMKRDDYLIYLIRNYSGYYNYFSKSDLYFDELKKIGIPNDYRDLTIKRKNGLPNPPEGLLKKIIILPRIVVRTK